jgi:anti-sigma regulatory factor (Ser/Thr protein kinase)
VTEEDNISRASTDCRGGRFFHDALFYRRREELVGAVGGFVEEGVTRGEPVMVLLPADTLKPVARRLDSIGADVWLQDISCVGRNPARLLPLLSDWVGQHAGPVRIASEAMWPGREAEEFDEVNRHESLVNLAFADLPGRSLCVYDAGRLPKAALAGAERTHPRIVDADGKARESGTYIDPRFDPHAAQALAAPTAPVEEISLTGDLARVRRRIGASPAVAPLPQARREDFLLAANEAAINALEYGRPPRRLRLWRTRRAVVAEVTGQGGIEDPLAGRRRPTPGAGRGRGLWLVNQVCDLVQLRTRAGQTTLRIHMRFA